MSDPKHEVLHWIATGQVGASSKAMAFHLIDFPNDGSYPYDASDLRRCHLMLEACPSLAAIKERMATRSKVWAGIMAQWNELGASDCVREMISEIEKKARAT